ncbi:MAG: hypothetical protein ACJ75B_08650 [Flavisolibacter sp.]
MAIAALIMQVHGRSYFAEGRRPLSGFDWFLSFLLLSFVLYAIWYYVRKWIIITVDISQQRLIILHPFQFKKYEHIFSEVIGFYLGKQYNRWCEIKELLIVLSTGKPVKITDMETGNLRQIEAVCWEVFALLDRQTKMPLTEYQKQIYRTENRSFDYRQAKSIRFSLIMTLLFLIFVAVMCCVPTIRRLPLPILFGALLFIPYVLFELNKIQRIIKTLQH